MFVIAGVTGHTGSVVAESLLARGEKVRVIVRDAAKGESFRTKGADVAVASVEDAASLANAVRGARGVYALIPPDVVTEDPFGRGRRIIDAWKKGLEGSGVEQFVLLSSVGAQHSDGTGPIRMLHEAERSFRAQSIPTTFVRAAYFVENWGSVLGAAKQDGVLPTFERPDTVFSQVATRDIGETAARALLESPREHRVIELAGPRDLSPDEIAATVGKMLGREVKPIHVAGEKIIETLRGFGISNATAQLFREMAEGLDRGHVAWETKQIVRGTTTVESVLRTLLQRA
jgi:uncharacterized protein YbjT (DUF2867 family)